MATKKLLKLKPGQHKIVTGVKVKPVQKNSYFIGIEEVQGEVIAKGNVTAVNKLEALQKFVAKKNKDVFEFCEEDLATIAAMRDYDSLVEFLEGYEFFPQVY